MVEFRSVMAAVTLDRHIDDRLIWRPNVNGCFSVKELTSLMSSFGLADVGAAECLVWHVRGVGMEKASFVASMWHVQLYFRNSLDIDIIKQCGILELANHGRKLRTDISISPEGNTWKIDSYEKQCEPLVNDTLELVYAVYMEAYLNLCRDTTWSQYEPMTPMTVRFRPEGYIIGQDLILCVTGSPVDRQGTRIYSNSPSPPSGSSGDDPNYDHSAHWANADISDPGDFFESYYPRW
ncbi:hypothetical protein V6N12_051327 [Hibiscus sabdariffa]|uniref:Uncharacterized protein n=1 Tax=Hibiscus sabdariffa TaxID=183260 RepID=A0ABR2GF97_9ROSI